MQADERQLSALELMMEHADSLSANVMGAPKPRRRARTSQPTVSARDFMRGIADQEDFEDYDYYVGPGSRALNRELRERRAAQRSQPTVRAQAASVTPVVSDAATAARPSNQELEHALENIFTANSEGSDEIVQALHQNTQISAQTAKTLHDWMEWEKSQAFKDANRVRTDDAAPEPTPNLPAVRQSGTDVSLPDADFGDEDGGNDRGRRRGRRYGRERGGRRGGRGGRGGRRTRGRGKLGALLGLAAAGGALWWANNAKEQAGENFENEDAPNAQQPTTPEVARQETSSMSQEQKDAAVGATSLAALAVGGAKRIPFVGPAVALAGAGYNAEQIANDDTMSDAEKRRAQTTNVSSAAGSGLGATAGAWIGGTLGSVVPGAGTLAGAALGGLIGGLLGDALGEKVGDAVADKMDESNEKAAEEADKQRQEDSVKANSESGFFSNLMPNWFSGMFGGSGGGGGGGNVARPAQFDSKQINEFAAKAAAGGLGSVSAQFESGGRGVSTVSTGAGDHGGVSYGAHQLATNNGSMMNFLNSKEGQPFLAQFGGQAPGTAGFNQAYKQLASTQGDALSKAQDDYITRTHYAPQAAKLQNDLGFDVSKRGKAVQEMVYSTAVQYGGNTNAVKRALQGLNLDAMTDDQIINTVQQSKAQNVGTDFKSSSASVQASVAARAENERKVLTQLSADEAKKKMTEALTPKADVTASPDSTNVPLTRPEGSDQPQTNAASPAQAPAVSSVTQDTAQQQARRIQDVVPRQQPIAPVETTPTTVERLPLVTAADIPQEPEPAQASSQTQQDAPRGATARSSGPATSPGGGAAKTHTMDDFPVFLDDPTLQMINVGYM